MHCRTNAPGRDQGIKCGRIRDVAGDKTDACGQFRRGAKVEQWLGQAGLAAKAALHPMGQLGTPQEVAALCLWLCSPAAGLATGG